MNYIDDIALRVKAEYEKSAGKKTSSPMELLRIYAGIVANNGVEATWVTVHNGWAVWRATTNPENKNLVPAKDLEPDEIVKDDPWVSAIRAVAADPEVQEMLALPEESL